jgi:hypothetical protein
VTNWSQLAQDFPEFSASWGNPLVARKQGWLVILATSTSTVVLSPWSPLVTHVPLLQS